MCRVSKETQPDTISRANKTPWTRHTPRLSAITSCRRRSSATFARFLFCTGTYSRGRQFFKHCLSGWLRSPSLNYKNGIKVSGRGNPKTRSRRGTPAVEPVPFSLSNHAHTPFQSFSDGSSSSARRFLKSEPLRGLLCSKSCTEFLLISRGGYQFLAGRIRGSGLIIQ